MLITQPSIMWLHGGVILKAEAFCCWLLLVFPKAFSLCLLTWALYVSVTQLCLHYRQTWFLQLLLLLISTTYLLSIYTYFRVVIVGAGSPLDFPELKSGRRQPENPYDDLGSSVGTESRELMDTDGGIGSGHSSTSRLLEGLDPGAPNRNPPLEFITSHTFKNNAPAYRWCSTCSVWKPDRCHHCSTCRQCFLRMDHHCPWFACCIGFRNHKFFIQTMMYVTAFCGLTFGVSAKMLYDFFAAEQYEGGAYLSLNLVFLFVVAFAFFVAVGCFTAFSMYMVFKNTTTIEFQDLRWNYLENKSAQYEFDSNGKTVKIGNIYDLGLRSNWCAIMGNRWYEWLLPLTITDKDVSSFHSGVNYEVDEEVYKKYCNSAQLQDQLNRQLAEYRDRVRGARRDES